MDPWADEMPYCIWHPETAPEASYRALVRRYPQMAYQVGRACAVAGYYDLFRELNIVPGVHIAEEARECGSIAVFDHIMAQLARYNVMGDYKRTINSMTTQLQPACLNGDTADCATLDVETKTEQRARHLQLLLN